MSLTWLMKGTVRRFVEKLGHCRGAFRLNWDDSVFPGEVKLLRIHRVLPAFSSRPRWKHKHRTAIWQSTVNPICCPWHTDWNQFEHSNIFMKWGGCHEIQGTGWGTSFVQNGWWRQVVGPWLILKSNRTGERPRLNFYFCDVMQRKSCWCLP